MHAGLSIEAETPAEHGAIHELVCAAFPTNAEARLVAALRAANLAELSLVARRDGRIVGHVLFSPVTIERETAGAREVVARGLGLAPISVAPAHQRAGIGSALIRTGLEQAAKLAPFCVVLGEPAYYARFGFHPASALGITSPYDAGDSFMIRVFGDTPPAGVVRYSEPFTSL